jgi:hypothetical protein
LRFQNQVVTAIRRFLILSSLERTLFLQALILLPIVRTSLVLLGSRRTQAWLDRMSRASSSPPPLPDCGAHAETAVRMVDAAARRGIVATTCLPRALVTRALLRRSGVSANLKFGVRRDIACFEAHAWVETAFSPSHETQRTHGFLPLEAPRASQLR